MLVFVITTVLHLFLWIVTWLFLTVKMSWKFKLRVTVGRAAVHNAKSIKLVNDIDLQHQPVDKENAPMLIVGFGKTFTIHDQAPKKLIMKTLARAAMETDQELEEEDTYWLRGDTPNGEQIGAFEGFWPIIIVMFKVESIHFVYCVFIQNELISSEA